MELLDHGVGITGPDVAILTSLEPAQAIIRTGGGNPISSCVDDPFSASPTCGWATDAKGNNIYASQGFCCACSSSAIAAATFTSGTNQGPSLSTPRRPYAILSFRC